ncbi:MAG: class I SAM-dependent methyltransferase [Gemmataceae bacterium]|nr:class I SAM-dependent methyltransferase [Gemmataceae bacterium]
MFILLLCLGAAGKGILELTLPEGVPAPDHAPERVSELLIDGKDRSKPRLGKRTLAVPITGGRVTVKYSFWPTAYQRVTRVRSVKVEDGGTAKLDLTGGDPSDRIRVIYVPTPAPVAKAMLELAGVRKGDTVWDIGCGDGRLVIEAVKSFGAKKGWGIDIAPERVADSRANAKKAGVEDRVAFAVKDALTVKDFSEADVVLLYLSDELNERLMPALRKTLKPGARIVSHRFQMGKWKPDETKELEAKDERGREDAYRLHLWRIGKGKRGP